MASRKRKKKVSKPREKTPSGQKKKRQKYNPVYRSPLFALLVFIAILLVGLIFMVHRGTFKHTFKKSSDISHNVARVSPSSQGKSTNYANLDRNNTPADSRQSTSLPANSEIPKDNAVSNEQNSTKARSHVSVIIDDMGRDVKTAEKFLALPYPLAFAVLPHEPHAQKVARMVKEKGKILLLHMPMEPHGYPEVKPGPGALLLSQSPEKQHRLFLEALRRVPGAIGVNNHMGSRFTEDREAMTHFLSWIKEEGLFFVDSRTTPKTVACEVANQLNVPCLERNVFLDHKLTEGSVMTQLDELAQRASKQGYALAIGHPHDITYRILANNLAHFAENGVTPISLAQYMRLF